MLKIDAMRLISIYGQESNYTTWRLAKMNLAIRGIDAQGDEGTAAQFGVCPHVFVPCLRPGSAKQGL